MAEKVVSAHSGANDLIGELRSAAERAKVIGDENARLEDELNGALNDNERLRSDEAKASHVLAEWTELLEDFRRGVRERDELIERTVGR